MLCRSRALAIILVAVGATFLLSNHGYIPRLAPLLREWWPVILIVVGVTMLVRS